MTVVALLSVTPAPEKVEHVEAHLGREARSDR
jgi:hypothetical protein